MSLTAKFTKMSSLYFLGSAVSKACAFFLTPMYTAYLLPEEFGYFNLSSSVVLLVISFFAMEVWTGSLRFIQSAKDPMEQGKYANVGFFIVFLAAALITVLFAAAGLLFHVEYLWYIYPYCIVQCFQLIYRSFTRGFERDGLYAVSEIVASIVTMGINVTLIVFFHLGVRSLFIGFAAGYFIQVCILEYNVRALRFLSRKYFDRRMLAEVVRFSAPLSFGAVFYWLSVEYGSVVISLSQGLAETGMYAVAGRFTGALLLFTQVFTLAMQKILYTAVEDRESLYSVSINYYFKFISMGALGMTALTKAIYPYLVNEAFSGSLRFVPLYLLATFVSCFALYLGNYSLNEKKTTQNALSLMLPAIINVLALHLLTERLGANAASTGLLLGYAACAVVRLVQLQKIVTLRLDFRYFTCFIGLTAVTLLVFFRFDRLWNFVWACVLGLILVWLFRTYIRQGWETLRRTANRGEGT